MDKSESEILEEWDLVSSVYDSEQEKNEAVVKNEIQADQSKTSSNDIPSDNNNLPEINLNAISENKDGATETSSVADSEQEVHSDTLKEVEPIIAKVETIDSETDSQKSTIGEIEKAATEGDSEEMSEPDTEEITVIETIMYDVKKISDVDSEKNIAMNIEKTLPDVVKQDNCESSKGIGDIIAEAHDDSVTKESSDDKTCEECEVRPKMNNFDSSVEHIESPSVFTETYPKLTEHETASIESSSSDIDIIDENIEDSVSSSFLHPLSLSISSSVDTSSVLTSPSEHTGIEEIKLPESDSCSIKSELSEVFSEKTVPKQSHYDYQQSTEKKSENVRKQSPKHRQDMHSNSIFGAILHFLRNMKCFEWSLLGGVVIGLYLTVVFNQTNIFTVVEQEDVVLQMKKMIDDLKNDNKILKDQMLSEMKNEKVYSSVEHQIKELRKENSRLNHMLYDVAKVLEKQRDKHERKDDDFLVPFKKEINKLKEQINSLKIDNEELQKQLVRIRYASYSQGTKDSSDDKGKKKNEETTSNENISSEEIPIDISSLKKWNELISLLSKELGLSLGNDQQSKGKSYSGNWKNINWNWKVFLQDFKGTFDELKANITSKLSDYKKVHENTISDIYKSVKKFFTVDEQNNQKFVPPGEENSQWNNFGDFFSDLKNKWSKIKNRIDASDLKNFFKDFQMSSNDETPQYESQEPKSSPYERREKPTTVHYETEKKPTNTHIRSDGKYDKDSEDTEWMFERAALRAELRETEKEDVNWFLKKKKHLSKDESEENKF